MPEYYPAYAPAPIESIIKGGPDLHPVDQAVYSLFENLRQTDNVEHTTELVLRNDKIFLLRQGIGSCANICLGIDGQAKHPTPEKEHTLQNIGDMFGRSRFVVSQVQQRQISRILHPSRKAFRTAIAEALLNVEPDQTLAATEYGAGRLLVRTNHWRLS